MRILFIIPEEFEGKRWGGVTSYTVELTNELYALGHDISILTPGAKDGSQVRNGVHIYKSNHAKPSKAVGRILIKVARRLSPDILERYLWAQDVARFVNSNGPFDVIEAPEWGSSTLFLPLNRSFKVVVRLHKSWMMYKLDNQLPIHISEWFMIICEFIALWSASAISSPTKFMLYSHQLFFRLAKNIPKVIIPNGVNVTRRRTNNSLIPLLSKKPYILFTGRIEKAKGCEELIVAFNAIKNIVKHTTLILIGEDTQMYVNRTWMSYTEYLFRKIKRYGLSKRVKILDKVSHDRLFTYYENALFLVLPALGHENCPMSVLEGMVANKAVVTTRTGGIPELVIDGFNGLLVSPGDIEELSRALLRLISDINLRHRLEYGSSFHKYNFSIKRSADTTIRFYRDIITA